MEVNRARKDAAEFVLHVKWSIWRANRMRGCRRRCRWPRRGARPRARGPRSLLLEGGKPRTTTSARNSGVIHAGLYHAPGNLKAPSVSQATAPWRLLRGAGCRTQLRQTRRRPGVMSSAAEPPRARASGVRRARSRPDKCATQATSSLHPGAALPEQRHRRPASPHAVFTRRHKCRRHPGVRCGRQPRALRRRFSS